MFLALALLTSILGQLPVHSDITGCEPYTITGYVRGAHSPWTANGVSVWTRDWIAAGSYNLPFGTVVQVQFPDGPGEYRIEDRGGGLGVRHIDILVDSVSEARALTSTRMVCIKT